MAEVTLTNVNKIYGGKVHAVKDINLEIKDKEFVCLLGPSGCGKTSTLRMIAGLESVTSGDILIGGVKVNEIEPKDRDIAMVFESYALYPHMSVFENMAFPLKVRKMPPGEIKERVQRAAEILQIESMLDRLPKQLSGGQKQRVAIGRAIVRDPYVFLYDEPISHLDAKLRAHMRAELKRLQKDLNTTTIYVTHDQLEAMTMADRIAVINYGVLQQFGTPNEVYYKPTNNFVAGFIGEPSINFMNCQLQKKDNKFILEGEGFTYKLNDNYQDILKGIKERKVILGMRPVDMSILKVKPEGQSIEGLVYITEPLGNEMIISISVKGSLLKVKTSDDFAVKLGEKVWVGVNDDRIYIFDQETGNAIA